jgi:amino acid adenylation domain-containing protein
VTAQDTPSWADGGRRFTVVRNAEARYSVWPAERPVPAGWHAVGPVDDWDGCLAAVGSAGAAPASQPACPGGGSCPHPSLLRLLAAALRRHRHRPAVRDDRRTVTYGELDRRSAAAADALRRRGVGAQDRVAVYLPRGVDVFVVLLAILRAGAAYVPVDVRYPPSRRDVMLRLSGARLVVTATGGSSSVADVPAVALEELLGSGPDPDPVGTAPGTETCGARTACVLFTSGSTGEPKGVVLEHRNLAYFAANPDLPALTPDDRVGHVSTVSFDAFTFEAWATLVAGAQVVVLPTVAELVAGEPERVLHAAGITAMLAPTMAVNQIAADDPTAFAGLRVLHTGGDVLAPAAARELLAGGFGGEFCNLYGPTEGTTACTVERVATVGEQDESVPIGRELAGARVYLLDADRQPVADGQPGELFIGGDGVAWGYLDRPALTAARFLPDPFGEPGSRMYGTGDRARRDATGRLDFLGRLDDQVKVRGYRVEPHEVERVLARLPGVREAAVLAAGGQGARHLVAIVVGAQLSPAALRAQAAARLPEFMVPSAFVAVDRMPANSHGKRDTPALLAAAQRELRRRAGGEPARDEIERYLVEVWQELLGVDAVGVRDDFFALGGNSMLAFRLRRRITRDLGVPVDVHDLLGVTVLADLAEVVRAKAGTEPA